MEFALVALVVVVLLMFLGVPIGACFGLSGLIGLILLRGFDSALGFFGTAPYSWASVSALLPLPLFVLMGMFAHHSAIGLDLFDTAQKWLGKLPGGLAQATMLACTGFAACTGDTMAAAAAMGTTAYPAMKKHGYSDRLATSCIAAGGTLGILIPPSGVFISYGFLTETSIRDLFIAGVIPGLVLSGMFLVLIFIMCKRNPQLGPSGQAFSWRERLVSLRGVWGMLALFVLIIGGLYGGLFTPREAGAMGAFGAFLIALVRRRITKTSFFDALLSSARITAMIFTVVIGAMIFNTFLAVSGAQAVINSWMMGLDVSRWTILGIVIAVFYFSGFILDALAVQFLCVPIFFPIVTALGFDPIWFGVLIVVLVEIALITPPLALNLYVTQGVTKVPLGVIFRGILPFIAVHTVFMVVLILLPQLALFLPQSMH